MNDASGSPSPTLAVPWTGTLMPGCPGGTSNSVLVTGSSIDTVKAAPLGRVVLLEPAMASIESRARGSATTREGPGRIPRLTFLMSLPREGDLRHPAEGSRTSLFCSFCHLLSVLALRAGRELDLE